MFLKKVIDLTISLSFKLIVLKKLYQMLNFFYCYAVLMIYILTSFFVSLLLFSLTFSFSKQIIEYNKLVAYECGFNSYSSARIMFDVHFFIVALLFLVFDVELIFLYP